MSQKMSQALWISTFSTSDRMNRVRLQRSIQVLEILEFDCPRITEEENIRPFFRDKKKKKNGRNIAR